MNVFAGFDGHSGGRTALHVMGITPTKYYASEVDKYAMQASAAVFPDIIQMGDITKWREWDINWSTIYLFIGGSPCQGFSMAGKMAGTTAMLDGEKVVVDTREKYLELKEAGAEFLSQSYLFWEYILLLDNVKLVNPKVKFFLENVKMKKEFLNLISNAIGVEPVFINSALLSAQNRQRYYWCNWDVTQPADKGIALADILESGEACELMTTKQDKSFVLTARYNGAVAWNSIERKQRTMIKEHGTSEKYRKLTPRECGRLQTIPEPILDTLLSAGISNSQLYKMFGNGWTIDIIVHIFSQANLHTNKIRI